LASGGPRYTGWSQAASLGPAVNTALTEQGQELSKDGSSLYFSRRPQANADLGGDDIWVSQRESDEEWGAPMKLGPTINTAFREYSPRLSRDQHWLFFSSDRSGGYGQSDMWASWRQNVHDDLSWQAPINLGPNVNSAGNDYSAGYFENDDGGNPQLFFTSDRPGGLGLTDIYMSELQADGSWGPATLIPELSSAEREGAPSIRHDGLEVLFFRGASVDLWAATRDGVDAPWSPPANLGVPPNANGLNEFAPALSADGQTLIFSSNRPGGHGQYDLYMTTRSKSHGK